MRSIGVCVSVPVCMHFRELKQQYLTLRLGRSILQKLRSLHPGNLSSQGLSANAWLPSL